MSLSPPLPPTQSYRKTWLDYPDQVELLIRRGLIVGDVRAAERFLSHVNYYRYSGYGLAFQTGPDQFKPGVTFEDVRAAYDFDSALRDLVTEALEGVEIDFRAAVAHHFGKCHGAFGHADAANFFGNFAHAKWLERLREETERSEELFVKHFRQAYAEYPDLPVWVLTEVMSFGSLSKMVAGLVKPDKKLVASRYGLQPFDFQAVCHHLTYVRNLCAHHARLWDRVWAVKPTLPAGKFWQPPYVPGNDRLYSTLLLLYRLLKWCPAGGPGAADWRARLHALLDSPPPLAVALARMGMPQDWKANLEWR